VLEFTDSNFVAGRLEVVPAGAGRFWAECGCPVALLRSTIDKMARISSKVKVATDTTARDVGDKYKT